MQALLVCVNSSARFAVGNESTGSSHGVMSSHGIKQSVLEYPSVLVHPEWQQYLVQQGCLGSTAIEDKH